MPLPAVTQITSPRLTLRPVVASDLPVARELVEGLTSDLLATRPGYWEAAGLPPPVGLEEAARRALAAEAGTLSRAGSAAETLAGWLTPRHRPGQERELPGT